jgi:excisionase family DNA binding protein
MGSATARQTYTVAEIGRMLGIGNNQAYEAVRRGDFPVLRVGKRLLVPKAAFDRLLEEAMPAPPPSPPAPQRAAREIRKTRARPAPRDVAAASC